jgi:hypothetical protein
MHQTRTVASESHNPALRESALRKPAPPRMFDTRGDDEPGGKWIADLDFRVAGPHPSLDKDPCDYAVELIG